MVTGCQKSCHDHYDRNYQCQEHIHKSNTSNLVSYYYSVCYYHYWSRCVVIAIIINITTIITIINNINIVIISTFTCRNCLD